MKTYVSINERIKDLRTERKLNLEQLSTQTGIPGSTIADYEKDDYLIPHTAIIKLADFFGVSADFLMGRTENRNMEKLKISSLHLTDNALLLLREKKINALLLSEIMTYKNFRRLMVDAEIYVDGLADMQIQNLNFAVDHIREKIKLTEKNLSAGEQFLGRSEIIEPDARKRRRKNGQWQKRLHAVFSA